MVIAHLRLRGSTRLRPLTRGGQEAIHLYSKPDVQPITTRGSNNAPTREKHETERA